MTKTIYIDGLPVEVTKKRIKRMTMRIKEPDARIVVSAPYLTPDREIIAFVRAKRGWIDNTVRRVLRKAEEHPEPASAAEKEARRADLKSGWTVRDMHTRWGSCNTRTHHVNFSLMLATRSDTELDYVILHELVHTVVPGHGKDFYALMDRFMPGWKAIRRGMRA